ncbi:MAG TPA: NAD(P)H-binding protein [Solirubrobacteraceae bacterium]|nr:NAD(P)H-binding protein [Solirubrobacteraceae bacterium]
MEILVTGASGFVGSALIPRLRADGHRVRAFARDPARLDPPAGVPVHVGDVVTGAGLPEALAGCEVAYFLVHSMEPGDDSFADRDRRAAQAFAGAAREAGVRRVIYLGGLVPQGVAASRHLASRLEVEEILLDASPESVALRASIVIAARSRSFRFLVRIVERLPVLALPAWRDNRTQPIDGRDVLELLARAAVVPEAAGRSLDIAGPDVLSYGAMIERIRDLMLLGRPSVEIARTATGIASRVGAVIAGEAHDLVGPLMEGLTNDLLPRDDVASGLLGVRLHRFDAAVERALREWEEREPLAAR